MKGIVNRGIGSKELRAWLEKTVTLDGSDLYAVVGSPPTVNVRGDLQALGEAPLRPRHLAALVQGMLSPAQARKLDERPELDLALELSTDARFRVNVYRERGHLAFVARRLRTSIPSFDELGLPAILSKLAVLNRGLLLVVGATGSGKSTTLAAMIDHRNRKRSGHIVTIEDPIEFVHRPRRSVISQRELGTDTLSYADGLKSVLRQAPSVVLIGEVRDSETAEAVLRISETGHLVLSTLHAPDTVRALERFCALFAEERQERVLAHLAHELVGIVAQRLILSPLRKRRFAALEILTPTPRARELIVRKDLNGLRSYMAEVSGSSDMQTFEDALVALIESRSLQLADALPHADSIAQLKMRLRRSKVYVDDRSSGNDNLELRML